MSTLTFLSVVVTVLGLLVLIGLVFVIVWLVKHVHRRRKQIEHERSGDDQPRNSSWSGLLDCGFLFSLAGLFGQGQNQNLTEEAHEDAETRPLLD